MSEEIPQGLIKKIEQVALTIAYGVHGLSGKKMPGIPSMVNLGASPQQVSQNPAASLSLMNKSGTAQLGLANSPPAPAPATARVAAAREAAAATKKGGRRTNKRNRSSRRTTYRR